MIESIITYGAETRVLSKINNSNINATETECWRRCCRILKTDNRLSNEEIRRRMEIEGDTVRTAK